MTDAIRRAVASPPEWDDVGRSPSMPGLRRRQLARLDVLAPSLAATKPAASALVLPVVLTGFVGPGAWLCVVIGVAGALVLRAVIAEFTSRMVTSGSLYTFVVRALGSWAGLVTAVSMVVGYAFACGYALTSTGLAVSALASPDVAATPTFRFADVLVVLGVGIACGLILMRRVSTFTLVSLAIQLVTVASVVVLVTAVLLTDRDFAGALSLSGADPARIIGGGGIMLAMLVGFECSASTGAEAAQPYKSVPWAMLSSLLITGTLCLVATIALSADPVNALDNLHRSVRVEHLWFADDQADALALFRVTRILSLVACTLALWAALARLVFTLAHESVLPRALARTHPRFLTPQRAVLWTAPLVIAPGALLVAADYGLQGVVASLLDTSGLVMLIGYFLVCLAVPVFLAQLGELTWRPVAASVAGGAVVVVAFVSNLLLQDVRRDADFVVLVAAAVVPAATWWYLTLRSRRPATLSRMGAHDETIESDAWCRLGGTSTTGGAR